MYVQNQTMIIELSHSTIFEYIILKSDKNI